MTTATQIIKRALQKANLIPTNASAPNDMAVIALELLNDWIAQLKNDGLDLQLDTLVLADTVYLDASDISCLKFNLTVLVADNWKVTLPQGVYFQAQKLLDDVRDKYTLAEMQELELPDGLTRSRKYNIESGV